MKVLLYDAVLFLIPGFFVCYIVGIRKFLFQTSLAISYGIALLVSLFASENVPISSFVLPGYVFLLILLLLIAVVKGILVFQKNSDVCKDLSENQRSYWLEECFQVVIVGLVITIGWAIGPYSEVPGDVWQHLENIRREIVYLDKGLIYNQNIWYFLQGLIWRSSDVEFMEYLFWGSIFNQFIFLGAVYSFAVNVTSYGGQLNSRSRWIGGLSVVFTVMFFGMAEFSYLRYYTFAPAFFSYSLYLLAIGLIATKGRRGSSIVSRFLEISVYGLCLVLTINVHIQEALFILVVTAVYVLVTTARRFVISQKRSVSWLSQHQERGLVWFYSVFLIVLISIIWIFVAGRMHAFLHLHRDIYDLGSFSDLLANFYVLRPDGQLADVIGIFGLVVMVTALFTSQFQKIPDVLVCTFLAVLVTVFNPAFTSLFFSYSSQEVLWRLAYLIPLPVIGAIVVVNNLAVMRYKPRLIVNGLVLPSLVSIILLSSYYSLWNVDWMRWKKIETLQRTPIGNSYEQWSDLIELLSQYTNRKDILTDPITGYVLSSTTHHAHRRKKFHKEDYIEFNKTGYSAGSFEDYRGWLIVINQRDGSPSDVGRMSGHWPEDVMMVSQHYTNKFVEFIRTTPRFKKVWEADRIEVYEVR